MRDERVRLEVERQVHTLLSGANVCLITMALVTHLRRLVHTDKYSSESVEHVEWSIIKRVKRFVREPRWHMSRIGDRLC